MHLKLNLLLFANCRGRLFAARYPADSHSRATWCLKIKIPCFSVCFYWKDFVIHKHKVKHLQPTSLPGCEEMIPQFYLHSHIAMVSFHNSLCFLLSHSLSGDGRNPALRISFWTRWIIPLIPLTHTLNVKQQLLASHLSLSGLFPISMSVVGDQ